jgi:hypothetical protein
MSKEGSPSIPNIQAIAVEPIAMAIENGVKNFN